MNYFDNQTTILLGAAATLILGSLYCWQIFSLRDKFKRRQAEMKRQLYELTILKELGERIGYSLNIPNIIEIICGSLDQLIQFSAVASLVVEADKVVFKIHLAEPVAKQFVAEARERARQSLSALLNKTIPQRQIKEVISGAVLAEEFQEPVRSFFNIPLVIGDQAVGVLTVAHTKPGLYREEEMTILYQITRQASLAVTRL
ncbi:MAG: GAF domain-containing protein, partial [Patescibacteria group bacterium]